MDIDLTQTQRKFLRSAARTRRPDVIVGKGGINEKTLNHILAQLAQRELVKIRLLESAGDDRVVVADRIAKGTDAVLVDLVGRIAVLYKPNDQLGAVKRLHLPEH